jgi:basic amino acid/polyamine antiporter, APA family
MSDRPTASDRRGIKPLGYFALTFGGIVGSAWILVLGAWLESAGPGGAVLGFVTGGAGMMLVAAAYAELACRLPKAGGEVFYTLHSFGPRAAFFVAWCLTVYLAAVCAFEGLALSWLSITLFPELAGPALYMYMGYDVTVGSLAIGMAGVAVIGVLNYLGVRAAVLFQTVVTYGFIAVVGLLLAAALALGRAENLTPLLAPDARGGWISGAFWIFALSAMFLSGFQVAPYAIEERHTSTSVSQVVAAMMLGVACAVGFYCLIILAAASATPWQGLVDRELPAAAAFGALTATGELALVAMGAALISLVKTWNSVLFTAAKLVQAQANLGFLPASLGALHPRRGSPGLAIAALSLLSAAGVLLGRGALLPIINTCSLFIALSFVLVLTILLRERARQPHVMPAFAVPGGRITIWLGLIDAASMSAILLYEPWLRSNGTLPMEWVLVGLWSVAGAAIILIAKPRPIAV